MELPNVTSASKPGAGNVSSLASFFASVMDRNLTWERAERLIRYWGGPFAIKGILSADDARRARDVGATAIVISNHGGRQLDGARAPINSLPAIAAAVGQEVELIVDGGIRRGNQVAKALAMGARACMIGRPYIYGLSSFGQDGVQKVLQLLCKEFERTLALLGCSSVKELGPHLLVSNQFHTQTSTDTMAAP
jgi:L-lactate dehydrogenase (cytochrome)